MRNTIFKKLNKVECNNSAMKVKNSEEKDTYSNLILQKRMQLVKLEKENKVKLEELKMICLDGDISENTNWISLKDKLENLQNKIYLLKEQLIKLTKEEKNVRKSEIISYQIQETGEEKTVELVNNEWEADPYLNKIWRMSPLGIVLTNKKVEEVDEVKNDLNNYRIKIIRKK